MASSEQNEVPLLSRLRPPEGAVQNRLRKGRGPGSGRGKTAGKGQKGQNSRSGAGSFIGFEGGQMPLQRRLPKRGFHNLFSRKIASVNAGRLNRFKPGTVVDAELLVAHRLVNRAFDAIKILGAGELDRALTVRAHAFSESARKKIEQAGGKVELVAEPACLREPVTKPAKQRYKERKTGAARAAKSEPKGAGLTAAESGKSEQ